MQVTTKHLYIMMTWVIMSYWACQPVESVSPITSPPSPQIYTAYSELENEYLGFNSVEAINHLADIDNEYFNNYEQGVSRYYGTVWRETADSIPHANDTSMFLHYQKALGEHPDSMHCTLYAYEGLKAGLPDSLLQILEKEHRRIWKNREIAGWSIGYILVQKMGWKAYLVLDRHSKEFEHCSRAYQQKKAYPVWKQPDIPLENLFIRGEQDSLIQQLLLEHEFSWGFSWQGYHTWVTRFETLKECNWLGAPKQSYDLGYGSSLFIETPFLDYHDYQSHVLVFPPKKI